MADLISREQAIVRISKVVKDDSVMFDIKEVLKHLPSRKERSVRLVIDGVELVRCRDCKHRFESMEMKTTDGTVVELGHYCKATGRFVGDDEFCSWAERKEKDE